MVHETLSPTMHHSVVFEDNGNTGYFYGLNPDNNEQANVDAPHISSVANVVDRDHLLTLAVLWSAGGLKAMRASIAAPCHMRFCRQARLPLD
jgi:hypothetical protein